MLNRWILLFNTIKYLKFKQVYYRLYYFTRNRYRKLVGFKYNYFKDSNAVPLKLEDSIENGYSIYSNKEFTFLNLNKKFEDRIDWNYGGHGKLWTYNLTYFEHLKKKENVWLIYNFIDNIEDIKDGLEPFPISLRGINWIKFLTKFGIKDKKIDDNLYAQYYILLDNLEYHLLGNHLLENGFSLLFGAYYFQDAVLYNKAIEILKSELEEQILDDGAHFELSPMYHQLMLFRLLDCLNLVQNNRLMIDGGLLIVDSQWLMEFLKKKASMMLGWLKATTFKNGDIPLLNDSANKIAPTSNELFAYAQKLSIDYQPFAINQSGYRKIKKQNYECIVDIGNIGPDYIPGHAHADTFNFVLYTKTNHQLSTINYQPFIIDTGTSTYEVGKIRNFERSTKAHNTVEINSTNSSEVWGGFRVANRAYIVNSEEKDGFIKATHNGYKKRYGILHTREWNFFDDKIVIKDTLNKEANAVARLHFHPDVTKKKIVEKLRIENGKWKISEYMYSPEFNKQIKALCIEISFEQELKIEIELS